MSDHAGHDVPGSFGTVQVPTDDRPAVRFFYEHAGWSYDPERETPEQGRQAGAMALADAETAGREAGLSFSWSIDPDIDSSDHSDDPDPWQLWECSVLNSTGEIMDSLGAVDFGRNGTPYSDPYRRVIEAELTLEHLRLDARTTGWIAHWKDDGSITPLVIDSSPNYTGPYCHKSHPETGAVCTRIPDHTGRHAAANGDRQVIAVWS